MQPKRVLRAKEIAEDIKSGITDLRLMAKYQLTSKQLEEIQRLREEYERERAQRDVLNKRATLLILALVAYTCILLAVLWYTRGSR